MPRESADIPNERAVNWLIDRLRDPNRTSQDEMTEQVHLNSTRYYQDLEYGEKHPSLHVFLRFLAQADESLVLEFRRRLRWPTRHGCLRSPASPRARLD